MNLCGIIRESDPKSAKKSGPAQQRSGMEQWALANGHKITAWESYVESATGVRRPEWETLVDSLIVRYRAGQFQGIGFERIDREVRNPFSSVPAIMRVLDAGLAVFFAQENLHLKPADPECVGQYVKGLADSNAYGLAVSRSWRKVHRTRAEQDKLPTNMRLFGFDTQDGYRVVNQAEAAALREAGEIVLKEGRDGPAGRWLNAEGWRTTRGNLFTSGKLARTLCNPAMVGETSIAFDNGAVVIHHDPIFERGKWQAIVAVLDGRRLREPRSHAFYALGGVVFCICGAKFEGGKARQYEYYGCKAHCGVRPWRRERLEFEVAESFWLYLHQRDSRIAQLSLAQQSEAVLRRRLAEIEKETAPIDSQWMTLLKKELEPDHNGYPAKIIAAAKMGLQARMASLSRERQRLESDLAALPQVDSAEVERALAGLAEPWKVVSGDGRFDQGAPHIMSWQRRSFVNRTWRLGMSRLSDGEAHLLREMVMRVNASIIVSNVGIRISGQLPLGSRANVPSC